MVDQFEVLGRPPYLGKRRYEYIRSLDKELGEGEWEYKWEWGNDFIEKEMASQIYEDAYYHDSAIRHEVWERLIETASDVYDDTKSNVHSELDYFKQETGATHLQDISIRRVLVRRGLEFRGTELVQIRSNKGEFGNFLNPGVVDFHKPNLIKRREIYNPGDVKIKLEWWLPNSVEDFYQSNRRVVRKIT